MRRLRVALVAMGLVGILGGNVAAQSPSPALGSPPWFGGRVEMPEHGFAVTLPDDWVAFDLTADVVGQFEGLLGSLGVMPDEELKDAQEALTQATIDGMQLAAIDGSEEGLCLFRILTGRSWTLDDLTNAVYQDHLSQDSMADVEPSTPIELPAGPGRVLAMRAQDPDSADSWASVTEFLIQADSDILMVVCTGPERPEDDYLSIAEGVEFLPAVAEADPEPMPTIRPSPSDPNAASAWLDTLGPVIDGGRVEQSEHGFAITFPDDWTVRQVTPAGARALWGSEGVPDGRSLVLAAEHTLRDGYCFVEFEDPSVWNGPVLLAAYAAAMESQWLEDPAYGDEERTRVDLPVGPAWRIDASFNTRSESWYLVRGADGIHRVGCASSDPPEDRWLSIAETFEFLPDPASGSMPSSPVLGGGRIERPVEGFAVTFPDDWTVEEVTPEIESALFPERDREGQALQTTILWADQPQSDGYCLVVDFTRLAEEPPKWRSVRAATRGLWVDWRDDETLVGPEHVLQGFPLGRMGHLSAVSVDGWTQDGYIYSDSALWMYLACWSPDPPEDRWLSIAETFEFLPAKE